MVEEAVLKELNVVALELEDCQVGEAVEEVLWERCDRALWLTMRIFRAERPVEGIFVERFDAVVV